MIQSLFHSSFLTFVAIESLLKIAVILHVFISLKLALLFPFSFIHSWQSALQARFDF